MYPRFSLTFALKTIFPNSNFSLKFIYFSGKFCWEATALYNTEDSTVSNEDGAIDLPEWPLAPPLEVNPRPHTQFSTKQALRHRSPSVLPDFEDTTDDLDNLDDLLQYIGHSR